MEKNRTSCPKAVCEKIFRAFTFGPAISTLHRISSRRPTPAKRAPTASLPNSAPPPSRRFKPRSAEGSEAQVLIKFDYTPAEKPKPTKALMNGSTQSGGRVARQPETPPTPSTVPGNLQTKYKPKVEDTNGSTQVQIDRPQANAEEATKPAERHDTFTAFIEKERLRMSHGDDDQDYAENSSKLAGHGRGGIDKD